MRAVYVELGLFFSTGDKKGGGRPDGMPAQQNIYFKYSVAATLTASCGDHSKRVYVEIMVLCSPKVAYTFQQRTQLKKNKKGGIWKVMLAIVTVWSIAHRDMFHGSWRISDSKVG